jgi:hypothetical protein
MLKFFRKNQQAFIVFIIVYCFSIVLAYYFLFSSKHDVSEILRFNAFANLGNYIPVTKLSGIILTIFGAIGLIFAGFYLVRLNINYLIIQKRTQFPAFFLIAISSFAFRQYLFSTAIIASLFLLMAIDRIFSSIDKEAPSLKYLDAGILIGLGSLFYNNLVFFLPFFLIAQFTFKQFNWKEFVYPLIGLIVPFIYIFSGYFLFNRPIIADLKITFQHIFLTKVKYDYPLPLTIGIATYLVFMIIANIFAIKKYATTKVQSRNLYQMIFYLFVIGMIVFMFVPSAGIELFFIISIPSSVLLSIYFSECSNSIINQIFFIILLLDPLVVCVLLGLK